MGTTKKKLPGSDNKAFWGDAEKISGIEEVLKSNKHEWMQRGNKAYCTSCPFGHGLFLAPDQEVRDGKIVHREPFIGQVSGS